MENRVLILAAVLIIPPAVLGYAMIFALIRDGIRLKRCRAGRAAVVKTR